MTKKEISEKRALLKAERQLQMEAQNDNRAQSLTVGSCGGGAAEIAMRGVFGQHLWNVYQPVEVIELINQMAAAIGCRIHIQPREDFASWRTWREPTEEDKKHLNGWPPFSEFLEDNRKNGSVNPNFLEDLQKILIGKENVETKENID